MAKFLMLTTLTDEGIKTITENPGRIKEVNKEVEAMGAKVIAQYALLGPYDFINIILFLDGADLTAFFCARTARGAEIRVDFRIIIGIYHRRRRDPQMVYAAQNAAAASAAVADKKVPLLHIPGQVHQTGLFLLSEDFKGLLSGYGTP